MFRGPLFFIFIINIHTSLCVIDALYDTGKQVWKLYTILDSMEFDTSHDARVDEEVSDDAMIEEMKKQVNEIHQQLHQLEKFMRPKKIGEAVKSWPLRALTIKDIDKIQLFVLSIDEYYEEFYRAINASDYSHDSLDALLQGVFLNVETNIEVMRRILMNAGKFDSNPQNLVAALAEFSTINEARICGTPHVISSILIHLFRMIIIAEMKTSTMLAYENFLGHMKNKDESGWQRMNLLAREKFVKQFTIYVNIFSKNMVVMNAVYNRACDPPNGNWIRDKSFHELEKTFQKTIFGYDRNKCEHKSCNDVLIEKSERCKPVFYDEKGSDDNVAECDYLGRMGACVLESGPHRFQFVDSEELGFLGRNTECPEDNGYLIETNVNEEITYVACACNSSNNRNKISILMMGSEVQSNRVITGLRFVRKNEVLWIQAREGTLGLNGHVSQYSQRWIPIPGNINSSLTESIDKNNRVFFLDDVTLAANYVLTGVKFNKVTRGSVSGFAIEIFGTRFNYRTGKLILEEDFRRSWTGSNEKAGKSLSFKAVSSVFTTLPHTATPSDTKYVSLERSTLKDDFGQSTLPLFDAVPIIIEFPSALGGVGIFHKGVEGYAGLISLRVYGIKYEEYFNDFKLSHIINGRVLFNSSFH